MDKPYSPIAPGFNWAAVRFVVVTFVLTLVAHAIAYLTHEYSHSILARLLGWMASPFGIDYGPKTASNLLFLGDVGDNVAYAPILARGHGLSAAAIALAGPFIGNGLLYLILYGLSKTPIARPPLVLGLIYWLCLMCAGNVWGYVPIRALTTHADIALAAQGLGIATWVLFPFVAAVSACIIVHFFRRTFPSACRTLCRQDEHQFFLLSVISAFWFFSFFGADGISGSYGPISQVLSIISRYLLFPLGALWLWNTYIEPNQRERDNDAAALDLREAGCCKSPHPLN